jgi:oligosaccharide repeat unit polymerase
MLLPDLKTFMLVSIFFITINIIAILLLLKLVYFVLTHNPGSLREGGLARIHSITSYEAIGMWILGHFSDFYVLLLVFFFYSRTYLKNKPVFNILLLISSMTTIINGLMSGGRTQIIYWILVFLSCFIYFKQDMSKQTRVRIMRFSFIVFSILTAYLTSVTISRFSGSFSGATDFDEGISLLDYAGQIFLKFNDFFANFEHKGYTVARIFPFLYDWFSDTNFELAVYKRSIPMDIGVFSTFLGDWYIDIGITGIAIYTVFYTVVNFLIRRNYIDNSRKFQQILLFFLIFQLPLNGLFYYSLYNKTAMISVLGTIFIAILFKFAEKDVIEVAAKEVA